MIADVLDINPLRFEKPGQTEERQGWGIKYRFTKTGKWRVSTLLFRKRSDAEEWAKTRYTVEEFEIVPVVGLYEWDGSKITATVKEL